MLKTENLVILFTDIAGFTESTSSQSREQNQLILEKHNSVLLPIVRRFRGRHIKSIGDALLLAFTSPTDAMRCAMAMQDALHEYNFSAKATWDIHIRVAASLGEVRVTKNDIFGEPVNVTSRIEGITPADEIYFSEAVYLAMNKAEVPAVEVGLRELKGISKPVRIFAIPRFAENRLVSTTQISPGDAPSNSFPYGGMHLAVGPVSSSWINRMAAEGNRLVCPSRTLPVLGGGIVGVSALGLLLFLKGPTDSGQDPRNELPNSTPTISRPKEVGEERAGLRLGAESVPLIVTPTSVAELAPRAALVSATVAASLTAMAPIATSTPLVHTPTPSSTEAAFTPRATAVVQVPQPRATATKTISATTARMVKPQLPKAPVISNILQAKLAYKANRIDKATYKVIVNRLEDEFDARVRQTKLDYRAGKFSKTEYKQRITTLKFRYYGRD